LKPALSDSRLLPTIDPTAAAQPATSARSLSPDGPLGVLDSGVGGLSVLIHLRRQLPAERVIYFADQGHIPYGPRPAGEIQTYTAEITRFLLRHGAKLIVVACNTATAAALDFLRSVFPDVQFVGMEPAVKPAALTTRSGKVGVLATPSTLNSHRYAGLMARFANGIRVFEDPCSGLVQLIEAGALAAPETRALLERVVAPMLAEGVDTLVLGCTHYPFIRPLLEEIIGDGITVIDPAPAVARRTRFVLQQQRLAAPEAQEGALRCFTSGDPRQLEAFAARVLHAPCAAEAVQWRNDILTTAPGATGSKATRP